MRIRPLFIFLFIFVSFSSAAQNSGTVNGQVLSESSEPLANVVVSILNTSFETSTGLEGNFSFQDVPFGSYILSIQKKGYAEKTRVVEVDNDVVELEIVLNSEMEKLREVVVTAQKREEVIQEIPLSITSLSFEAIKQSQIQNVNDLTAITPNLYASDPGDRRTVTSIRGIVSTSYDPAVATYIDGVNQFNLDTYITQLFDIERIEVLRGPQGTLYGRNAMGGVINIITRKPEKGTNIFGEVSLGNYDQQRYMLGLKTTITDKLYFGAAGLYEKREGFYTNEFTDSSYDDQENFSGNYYFKYLFSPTWNATLNLKHFSAENEGAFPLNMGIEGAFEDPYTLNQNEISTMKDNTFNTSLVVDHKGRGLNFSSQTAFQQNYRYYHTPIDADFSPLDAMSIINDYGKDWNNVKVATQEFRFSSPAGPGDDLEWTAGTYMFYQESPVKQATHFGEDAAMMGSEETNFSLINTSEETGKGIAIFGQVDYQIAKNIGIIAGLRYDHEYVKQSVLGEYKLDSDPEPMFAYQPDTTATASFNAVSPKAGLTYDLTNENLLFFTYSRGFRAGGLTPLSADPSQPPLYEFKPEYSNNYELGTKNSFFDNKLLLNATLFYTEVTDVQVPTLVMPEGVIVTRNTGKMRSKGVELEMKALLLSGLELNYDFGLTDATYESLLIAQDGSEVNLKDNKQIYTPEVTSMLALQYSSHLGLGENWEFQARGE
ncbi:iron complex outermembrane recepter protein [Salinimicrobium catena]|uniref:Iron complex outermembrane recepter protein n=1 Tax=Salinimicrobium catena TaxID=390640 RepID=A0A1H5HQU1_9FLAO|nr:TonB-dependent receptor [Salinimicrobium catena]SDK72043.1 iron complex outermembrane recepter protein [Salinimicrobium catena]SEE30386.1 iron complex outermembrane recepter protein [Salinimicrobium catena]